MIKIKNGRLALSSKYAVWSSKKSRFMKEQETCFVLIYLHLE